MGTDREFPVRLKPAMVDGLLLLNKPAGMTSNQALQKVKRLLKAKKAGHTGSLDPAATGMLPLCFGEATKICAYLLEADKTYRVTARLGERTDTADADGVVTETAPIPEMTAEDWQAVIAAFKGEIMQVPPMYSALKKDGKRLYELARQGQVVERDARPVTIHSIQLLESTCTRLRFNCQLLERDLYQDLGRRYCGSSRNACPHVETTSGDGRRISFRGHARYVRCGSGGH